jgi:hypothetical protein
MRHSATRALLERDDVIIVASVSCIYGIGSVETYGAMTQDLHVGREYDQRKVMADLSPSNTAATTRRFSAAPSACAATRLEIWPAHLEDRAWKLSFFGEELESITEFDPLTGAKTDTFEKIRVYANSHYVTPRPTMQQAMKGIKAELRQRLEQLVGEGKLLEAQRLEQRTNFDLEMLEATGVCNGIENYSRYLTAARPGNRPPPSSNSSPTTPSSSPTKAMSRPPDRRHVSRRLPAQVHAGRTRLPPALLHGQPPPEVRGMGRDAPAIGLRLAPPPPNGRWSRPAASSPNRSSAPPA